MEVVGRAEVCFFLREWGCRVCGCCAAVRWQASSHRYSASLRSPLYLLEIPWCAASCCRSGLARDEASPGTVALSRTMQSLWELACQRRGRYCYRRSRTQQLDWTMGSSQVWCWDAWIPETPSEKRRDQEHPGLRAAPAGEALQIPDIRHSVSRVVLRQLARDGHGARASAQQQRRCAQAGGDRRTWHRFAGRLAGGRRCATRPPGARTTRARSRSCCRGCVDQSRVPADQP